MQRLDMMFRCRQLAVDLFPGQGQRSVAAVLVDSVLSKEVSLEDL
jgi:hypothetical protein